VPQVLVVVDHLAQSVGIAQPGGRTEDLADCDRVLAHRVLGLRRQRRLRVPAVCRVRHPAQDIADPRSSPCFPSRLQTPMPFQRICHPKLQFVALGVR
jgi:hypothetical protein